MIHKMQTDNHKRYPIEEVSEEQLEYWAESYVGGSGLSVSIQKLLRDMAIELIESREKLTKIADDEERNRYE